MNMAGRFTLRRSAVPEPETVAEPASSAPSWMAPAPEAAKDKVPAEPSIEAVSVASPGVFPMRRRNAATVSA